MSCRYLARWPCSRSARARSARPGIVGRDRPCVAERAEVLPGVEAEGGRQPSGPGADSVAGRPVRLAGVLDDRNPVVGCERDEGGHVRELSVEMHGHQESRSGPDRCGAGIDVEVVVALAHIDRHGATACLRDRLEGGDERVRRDDHLVARLDPRGQQGETQPVEAVRDADAGRHAAVTGECLLERGHRRPVRERAALQDRRSGRRGTPRGWPGPRRAHRETGQLVPVGASRTTRHTVAVRRAPAHG